MVPFGRLWLRRVEIAEGGIFFEWSRHGLGGLTIVLLKEEVRA